MIYDPDLIEDLDSVEGNIYSALSCLMDTRLNNEANRMELQFMQRHLAYACIMAREDLDWFEANNVPENLRAYCCWLLDDDMMAIDAATLRYAPAFSNGASWFSGDRILNETDPVRLNWANRGLLHSIIDGQNSSHH